MTSSPKNETLDRPARGAKLVRAMENGKVLEVRRERERGRGNSLTAAGVTLNFILV